MPPPLPLLPKAQVDLVCALGYIVGGSVVRHDGFHCQNTYMLLIVGVQSTVFDNFQKCLVRILAFSTNFYSIKIDLPGNPV